MKATKSQIANLKRMTKQNELKYYPFGFNIGTEKCYPDVDSNEHYLKFTPPYIDSAVPILSVIEDPDPAYSKFVDYHIWEMT